jgi:hypothetical protein
MINNISEGALRIATKADPIGPIHDREASRQKAEELRQARPIEKSEPGNHAGEKKSKEEDLSKYLVDDNQLVFEKYDHNGDLVIRIPPSSKPVDERI